MASSIKWVRKLVKASSALVSSMENPSLGAERVDGVRRIIGILASSVDLHYRFPPFFLRGSYYEPED